MKSGSTMKMPRVVLAVLALVSLLYTTCVSTAEEAPIVRNEVTVNMLLIHGGTFLMGSPQTEDRTGNESPQHEVTVSSFYMSKYEVTVGEFRQFVLATAYKSTATKTGKGYVYDPKTGQRGYKEDADWDNPYFNQQDTQPVTLVSWYDAVSYCNWRSQQAGLTPAYRIAGTMVLWNASANGYRLPTEAEWEYACRAGTTTAFSTGANITTDEANYDGNYPYNGNRAGVYRGQTTPVGSFAPNPWGLYDMHGNVYEWCWDLYGSYPSDAQTNPLGPDGGANRVWRGGSWSSYGQFLRSGYRFSSAPSYSDSCLGFRIALSSFK